MPLATTNLLCVLHERSSRFIHIEADFSTLFLLIAESYYMYVCVWLYQILLIHSSVDWMFMVSIFWLLWIMPQWTFRYMFLYAHVLFILGKPVELLGQMVTTSKLLRNCQTVFQSNCPILHSDQQMYNMFCKYNCMCAPSCPTLGNSVNYSQPGSSVHGIFQARIMEWAAISYSRGSSETRDRTTVSCVSCIGSGCLYHCAAREVHKDSSFSISMKTLAIVWL